MSGEAASWTEIKEPRTLHTHFAARLWNLFQMGILFYGLVTAWYVFSWWRVGETSASIAFLNNFMPWAALFAVVFGIIGLFSRWRLLLTGLQVPVLALFLVFYGDLLLPPPSIAKPAGVELTAATYNIHSDNSDPTAIVRTIQKIDADMIAVEELGPDHADRIASDLIDEYPYQLLLPSPDHHGVGLLSRYPINDYNIFNPYRRYVRHIRVLVQVEDTTVAVYVTHPHSPYNFLRYYDDSLRRSEMEALRETLQTDSGPVLVLCDCNMTQASEDYRKLDRMLDDSFRETGWGMGFTFPANGSDKRDELPLMVRLDYVWHNDAFTAYDTYVVHSNESDHLPVVARLVLESARASEDATYTQ